MPLSVPLKTSRTGAPYSLTKCLPRSTAQTTSVVEANSSQAKADAPKAAGNDDVENFVKKWGLSKEQHPKAVKFVGDLPQNTQAAVIKKFAGKALLNEVKMVTATFKVLGVDYYRLKEDVALYDALIATTQEEVAVAGGTGLIPQSVTVRVTCGSTVPLPLILQVWVNAPIEISAASIKLQLEKLSMASLSSKFSALLTRLTCGAPVTVEIKVHPQLEDGNMWKRFTTFVRSVWLQQLCEHAAVGIYLKRLPEEVQMKVMTSFDPSEISDKDVMTYLRAISQEELPPSHASAIVPMHLATGARWGHNATANKVLLTQQEPPKVELKTPQAVIKSAADHARQRELKLLDTKGPQVMSNRATVPAISFHNGPTGRVVEEKARCRELGEHPCLRNPGPENYKIEPQKPVCMVPHGWSYEARFKNSAFAPQGQGIIKFSTEAHPFSPAYPYEAPKPMLTRQTSDNSANADNHVVAQAAEDELVTVSSRDQTVDNGNRRNPIRTADLNCQYFKYKEKPRWGFGSSGLGYRFMPGTAFSRQAPVRTSSRLRGFRDLREELPEMMEKDYQAVLEKTLAEAAVTPALMA
jgi:hypothetical protein